MGARGSGAGGRAAVALGDPGGLTALRGLGQARPVVTAASGFSLRGLQGLRGASGHRLVPKICFHF